MVVNSKGLYNMLISEDPNDVKLAMGMSKFYKGTDKKIIRLINFYKILKISSFASWSNGLGRIHTSYPLNLSVPSYLDLSYSNITILDLPNNLYINGDLLLHGNKGLRKLPDNLKINGILNIANTNINYFPKNLHAKRIINADGDWDNDDDIKEIIKKGGKIVKFNDVIK